MEKTIKLETHEEARVLCGARDENLKTIEKEMCVKLTLRAEHLKVSGGINNIKKAAKKAAYHHGLSGGKIYNLVSVSAFR